MAIDLFYRLVPRASETGHPGTPGWGPDEQPPPKEDLLVAELRDTLIAVGAAVAKKDQEKPVAELQSAEGPGITLVEFLNRAKDFELTEGQIEAVLLMLMNAKGDAGMAEDQLNEHLRLFAEAMSVGMKLWNVTLLTKEEILKHGVCLQFTNRGTWLATLKSPGADPKVLGQN